MASIVVTTAVQRIVVDPASSLVSVVPVAPVVSGGGGGGGGGVTDHGALTGRGDDDHTQYALANGTRGDFATTAQGALADTATQPADLAASSAADRAYTDSEIAAHEVALDPHPQYLTSAEGDAAYDATGAAAAVQANVDNLTAADIAFVPNGNIAATDVQAAIQEVRDEAGAGGVTDHGALTGLSDDDHVQYALADGTRGDFEVSGAAAAVQVPPAPRTGFPPSPLRCRCRRS